ncbi:MAG: hypothetical protein ACLFMO_06505 [Eubacteriales bacterium]
MTKIIKKNNAQILYEVTCNKCGKMITAEQCPKVDFITISKNWGYFSNKDNQNHSIDLCEKCYDEWIKTFAIPPKVKKNSVCI